MSRFFQPLAGTLQPGPQVDENVTIARTMNMLGHYTGNTAITQMARHACVFFLLRRWRSTGLRSRPAFCRLAGQEPQYSSVALSPSSVERMTQPPARSFHAAVGHRVSYKRVEWWDARGRQTAQILTSNIRSSIKRQHLSAADRRLFSADFRSGQRITGVQAENQ